ncbi:WD40-repeat-containing domain protein [Suillus occidentalis]|nr:WD40-repeat-containing domain protein [Suillus occidentalis]
MTTGSSACLYDGFVWDFRYLSDEIWAVAWTANNTAVFASADGTVKQWNSTSGQVAMSRPPHNLAIVSLSVSLDGKFALYNGLDGTTRLWHPQSDTIVRHHKSYDHSAVQDAEPSWSVSLNPNGMTYAGTSSSGNVNTYSANPDSFETRQAVLTSGRSRRGMVCVHSPDGTRVALSNGAGQLLLTASGDKRLILHEVRSIPSGKPGSGAVATLTGHSSLVLSTSISPETIITSQHNLAFSGVVKNTIHMWDTYLVRCPQSATDMARSAITSVRNLAPILRASGASSEFCEA